jgi:asparagine synthase (glutamine-hydrolysing)
MSGICGICEPGMCPDVLGARRMLSAATLQGETTLEVAGRKSIAFGVSKRWRFQGVGNFPDLQLAVDAELFDAAELAIQLNLAPDSQGNLDIPEIVAGLYRRHGISFLEKLNGVFSIAIWDPEADRLVLAIDRLGVNFLYWRRDHERLLFATRISAVKNLQQGEAEIDPSAIVQYMIFSAVPAPTSIYKGIERLRAGHCLVYENGEVRQTRYWDLNYPEDEQKSVAAWADELRGGMRSAVHSQIADLDPSKSGAYLSGGTDSSSVVAFMSERQAPANTFSIFFKESTYSEIEFARTTGKKFQTRHHELSLSPSDTWEAIPRIIEYYDEPFANSSAIGGYYCAKMAREVGVTTLLAGDGGDELFAGNERYASDKKFQMFQTVPHWLRKGLIEPLVNLLPLDDSKLALPRKYVRRANIPLPRRIYSYHFLLNLNPHEIFEPEVLRRVPPATWLEVAESHYSGAGARSDLNRLLYLDVKMTLADNDLRKVLGTAEMAGVRARFPLLDYKLAELSGRIPSALKMKGFEKRFIFKEAMKDILPQSVLYKKKHGFGVPVALWFSQDSRLEELVNDVLRDTKTIQRGYFRPSFIERLLTLSRGIDAHFYGEFLWYLVALELWHRKHHEVQMENVLAN